MITNNMIASCIAVFQVTILNLDLVDTGSIYNLDGKIVQHHQDHVPFLEPPSAFLMSRKLKFGMSHQTIYTSHPGIIHPVAPVGNMYFSAFPI